MNKSNKLFIFRQVCFWGSIPVALLPFSPYNIMIWGIMIGLGWGTYIQFKEEPKNATN